MRQEESRPYAGKTDAELAAISEWLADHMKGLQRQEAAIREERRIRLASTQEWIDAPAPAAKGRILEYLAPEARGRQAVLDHAYADSSRRYAMKVTCIGFAIGVVIVVVLCIAAAL